MVIFSGGWGGRKENFLIVLGERRKKKKLFVCRTAKRIWKSIVFGVKTSFALEIFNGKIFGMFGKKNFFWSRGQRKTFDSGVVGRKIVWEYRGSKKRLRQVEKDAFLALWLFQRILRWIKTYPSVSSAFWSRFCLYQQIWGEFSPSLMFLAIFEVNFAFFSFLKQILPFSTAF